MPTVVDTPVRLWAYCRDGACPGYETEELDGLVRETSTTNFEEAGPMAVGGNAVSRSSVRYFVPSGETDDEGRAVPAELPCPECGKPREVSPQPRPEYAAVSGQDPMELLNKRSEAKRGKERDTEIEALKAQIAQQNAQMGQLMAALAPKAARRTKAEED